MRGGILPSITVWGLMTIMDGYWRRSSKISRPGRPPVGGRWELSPEEGRPWLSPEVGRSWLPQVVRRSWLSPDVGWPWLPPEGGRSGGTGEGPWRGARGVGRFWSRRSAGDSPFPGSSGNSLLNKADFLVHQTAWNRLRPYHRMTTHYFRPTHFHQRKTINRINLLNQIYPPLQHLPSDTTCPPCNPKPPESLRWSRGHRRGEEGGRSSQWGFCLRRWCHDLLYHIRPGIFALWSWCHFRPWCCRRQHTTNQWMMWLRSNLTLEFLNLLSNGYVCPSAKKR